MQGNQEVIEQSTYDGTQTVQGGLRSQAAEFVGGTAQSLFLGLQDQGGS
jgi:hypothetical protein